MSNANPSEGSAETIITAAQKKTFGINAVRPVIANNRLTAAVHPPLIQTQEQLKARFPFFTSLHTREGRVTNMNMFHFP